MQEVALCFTPETSDVAEAWIPRNAGKSTVEGYTAKNLFEPTATIADASTILPDNLGQRSWSLEDYRIVNPTTSSSCGSQKNDLCNARPVRAYATPIAANGDELATLHCRQPLPCGMQLQQGQVEVLRMDKQTLLFVQRVGDCLFNFFFFFFFFFLYISRILKAITDQQPRAKCYKIPYEVIDQ